VRTLHAGVLHAGPQSLAWDGRDDRGRVVAAGVYFALVTAAGQVAGAKITVVR